MRLAIQTANDQVNALAARLDGGSIEFYTGAPPGTPEDDWTAELLVSIPLPAPAFHHAQDGRAISHDLPATLILVTGEARWGRFVTSQGEVIGDMLARTPDAPDVEQADAIFERTDFHRGGLCAVSVVVLRLPQS